MNILGVQIISILFAIFMIYVAFLHWKKNDINGLEIFFWLSVWFGFILVTLFPNTLQKVTRLLFFARVMDLLMVIAFMILAFLAFQNYIANHKLEKKIEDLVRKEAINEDKKRKRTS